MADVMSFPSMDEQERMLKEASTNVKKSAYFMRKALDEDNLREALRYSAQMLGELRTSFLTPQKYYELYMQVFDELVNLETFFAEERSKGRTYAELYELVQHAGNVLPRLYLMVAVGCLYIKSGEASSKDILRDLVDMCKGVQHPTRGLFLRSYLCQRSRLLVPDTGSPYEGEGGSITDALDFLLSNFTEMNKLWVRMQHQGSARERDRREKERQQLQDLVGKNLTFISQLDGLDFRLYSGLVLPRVLEQIVSCKDDIAQQYLMQCVIQGFPDAFHLGTLDSLLGALPELQPGVKLHAVMSALMDRLARYAASDAKVMQDLLAGNSFERFQGAIAKVIELHVEMPPADVVEMYAAMCRFTQAVYGEQLCKGDKVLAACHKALETRGLGSDIKAEKALVTLLALPLARYSVPEVLQLGSYPSLVALLQQRTRKQVAQRLVQALLDSGGTLGEVGAVEALFGFIRPLLEEGEEGEMDDEDFEDEQMLVARLLHSLVSEDVAVHFAILGTAREQLAKGGPRRLQHTFPALVFAALKLVDRIVAAGADAASKPTSEHVLQWVLATCLAVADAPAPLMALRLLLASAQVASEAAGLELLSYEFFERCFLLYEECVADQRQKIVALQGILGALHRCYVFTPENRDALVASATAYASKLLKRSDQCRAVCACSHLSWQPNRPATAPTLPTTQPPVRDVQKVLACLKRAIKIANAAKQQRLATALPADASHVALYVEILNLYLQFFEESTEVVGASMVEQMVELIREEMSRSEAAVNDATRKFWEATVAHVTAKGEAGNEAGLRFAALQL